METGVSGMSKTFCKWISVLDEHPDNREYDWVLVTSVAEEDRTFRLVPDVAEWRRDHWATHDSYNLEEEKHVRVTHWTPLPDNPDDPE
jgi:hypothetical protein